MPARLRPTAPIAATALLVGDPGRALALAQELLETPKMSNHARGLWGYSGESIAGGPLTIQSTGMGGPSAAVVLGDLAELGVRTVVRVGSCTALRGELPAGTLVTVEVARAWPGPGGGGEPVSPDPDLSARLRVELGEAAVAATVASLDVLHIAGEEPPVDEGEVADMQTAALLGASRRLGIAAAVVLIVSEGAGGERLGDEELAAAAKVAGAAAAKALNG